jgi:putative phosphoesterase
MRLAVMSDIHGNLFALDAALAAIDRAEVDQVICLGDLAVLGPEPGEVINRLRERDIPCVCGNTDTWVTGDHPLVATPPESAQSIELAAWTASRLSPAEIDYLRSLPRQFESAIGDETILGFHATPDSLDDITHAGQSVGEGEWPGSAIMLCGHTHVQGAWRVGSRLWINPGSVGLPGVGPGVPGLPVNDHVAWSEFAILESDGRDRTVALHRIPLDVAAMWARTRESDMPHQAWWRALWAI